MNFRFRLRGWRRWAMLLVGIVGLVFGAAVTRHHRHNLSLGEYKAAGDYKSGLLLLNLGITGKSMGTVRDCSHFTCFDVYRCNGYGDYQISVYSYPEVELRIQDQLLIHSSSSYLFQTIRSVVHRSSYYTGSSSNACILFPPIDFLHPEAVQFSNLSLVLGSLPEWNDGLNHLIFTMQPGIIRAQELHLGKAMVAGTGFTKRDYRTGFDISIPFFHPSIVPQNAPRPDRLHRRWLLAVIRMEKTKEMALELQNLTLANTQGVLSLSICSESGVTFHLCSEKRSWQFPDILVDIQFCLVTPALQPFLLGELLRMGCIPVLFDSNLVLPFSEVLDWKRAAVFFQWHHFQEGVEFLQRLNSTLIAAKRESGLFFYKQYFSDITAIFQTTIEILNSRLFPTSARTYKEWNIPSKAPPVSMKPNPHLQLLPGIVPKNPGFTAVILAYDREENLAQLVALLERCPSLQKILIIWNNQIRAPPSGDSWPKLTVTLEVIRTKSNKLNNRFIPYDEITTDAVFSLDDDILMLTPDEIEFGFQVWSENSDRLVGFPSRLHTWNASSCLWEYDPEWSSRLSIVLTGAAFYSQLYNYYYTHKMPRSVIKYVDDQMNCEDIAMNFLIANTTGKSPIKVGPRKKFRCPECSNRDMLSADFRHLSQRSHCVNYLVGEFGFMPLIPTEFRADPVLFKELLPSADQRYPGIGVL